MVACAHAVQHAVNTYFADEDFFQATRPVSSGKVILVQEEVSQLQKLSDEDIKRKCQMIDCAAFLSPYFHTNRNSRHKKC